MRTRDPARNTIVTREFLFKYEELVECWCEFAVVYELVQWARMLEGIGSNLSTVMFLILH